MSSTFTYGNGYIQTNAVTPVVVFMNQLQNSTVVIDVTVSPTGIPTVPLTLSIQVSGQIWTYKPEARSDGTFIFRSLIIPPLAVVRALGNPYCFRYTGFTEVGQLPAGLSNVANGVTMMEAHPDRPLGAKETVLLAYAKWGATIDMIVTPIAGTSPVPKAITLNAQFPSGSVSNDLMLFKKIPVSEPMTFRKLVIPPSTNLTCTLYGNVSVYFTWAWQRIQDTPDIK